ncbi:MAG: hydrogenase [Candidatus Omnitrophota bacterium]|jgi:formate hydrogenlyase subunit 4|nr:MAG: hydrogenase [Candidatus Omnitrophota bacterium]
MNAAYLHLPVALIFAPALLSVINRIKALFAGRTGPPLLQPYYDLAKLLKKGAVYSRTTTWVFRMNPIIGLSAVLVALAFIPFAGSVAVLATKGDIFILAYVLGLARFFLIIAALDAGSSFEGMGASREAQFSALTEPAFLVGLAAVSRATGGLSLSEMYGALSFQTWMSIGPIVLLVAAAFLIVLLTENARIPVDDPNTHLELTMIHEVMVLDYSGPDLAMIFYASALKLWIFGSLLVGLVLPIHGANLWLDALAAYGGMVIMAVCVGVIESCMARLRLLRIPQLLVAASSLSILAFLLLLR